jgi:PAS domain S-box-containing protein
MTEYCFEPGLTQGDVAEVLRAVSPSLAAAAPVVGLGGEYGAHAGKAIFASMSLLRLFGARDLAALSERMFAGADPGSKQLADLAAHLPLGGPPHLERAHFVLDGAPRSIAFLCRRLRREGAASLFVAAAVDGVDDLMGPARLGSAVSPESSPSLAPGAAVAPPSAARNAGAIRFVWSTDADNRIVEASAPFAQILGVAAAALVGRKLAEIVRGAGGDLEARLSQLMARKETWVDVRFDWRIAGAAGTAPVRLGAAARFDRDRRFAGYRGFGVIEVERIAAEPPAHALAQPAPESPRMASQGAEIIPLRPSAAGMSAASTLAEQDAFHAIAFSLGAKPALVPAGRDAEAAKALVDGQAIFDLLPLGALVCDGRAPIFANRFLLDLLDCADLEGALAAGVLERLLEALPRLGRQSETIELRSAAGDPISLRARRQIIAWGSQKAVLATLQPSAEIGGASLEARLRGAENEARELSAILDTAMDGVAVLDAQGRIAALNRSGEALFGYDKSEVAGEPFAMLLAPDSRARAKDYFEGLKANGVESLLNDGREIMGLARQGGTIPLFMTLGRITAGAERDEDVRFCALLRDMTHWKKVEGELDEARRRAERASALKSDFLAKVSHEIRTPLNAILGFAEVIMEERFGPIGNERYKDYLKDIHSSGALVMSLVNDLLDLSKIEAGKMDLDFALVDANRIVAECVSIMQPQASRARVIVRLALAAGLPHVVADERSLRQIVLNLLSNAVKFTQPGGQVIVATALTDSGQAALRIRDTGVGMSDADIEVALEPFRQLATSRPAGGTGLGLPLTKALVEANRAYFSITSRKHEGTLVEVAFPLARILAG